MQGPNVFLLFLRPLNRLKIPYVISGGVAAILYGEPRLTNDVDLIVDLHPEHFPRLSEAFPPTQFYFPGEETLRVEAARAQRGHFNIIHHETGLKADVYLKGRDPLHIWALKNPRRITVDGQTIPLAPVEYVIIRKLEFFREGGSPKHIEDIRGILRHSGGVLDDAELRRLIEERGLDRVWNQVQP